MTASDLKKSISQPQPPSGLSTLLQALWYEAKGDWAKAHALAQEDATKNGALVHAYLHRKEGDDSNAHYWYRRAGKDSSHLDLKSEWEEIARILIEHS